jgi:hypothetical protein
MDVFLSASMVLFPVFRASAETMLRASDVWARDFHAAPPDER